jgi:hypothetical protein
MHSIHSNEFSASIVFVGVEKGSSNRRINLKELELSREFLLEISSTVVVQDICGACELAAVFGGISWHEKRERYQRGEDVPNRGGVRLAGGIKNTTSKK